MTTFALKVFLFLLWEFHTKYFDHITPSLLPGPLPDQPWAKYFKVCVSCVSEENFIPLLSALYSLPSVQSCEPKQANLQLKGRVFLEEAKFIIRKGVSPSLHSPCELAFPITGTVGRDGRWPVAQVLYRTFFFPYGAALSNTALCYLLRLVPLRALASRNRLCCSGTQKKVPETKAPVVRFLAWP